jgi:hypothetical protein
MKSIHLRLDGWKSWNEQGRVSRLLPAPSKNAQHSFQGSLSSRPTAQLAAPRHQQLPPRRAAHGSPAPAAPGGAARRSLLLAAQLEASNGRGREALLEFPEIDVVAELARSPNKIDAFYS